MRLSTDDDRDEENAFATIEAAAEAGITVFDVIGDVAKAHAPDAAT